MVNYDIEDLSREFHLCIVRYTLQKWVKNWTISNPWALSYPVDQNLGRKNKNLKFFWTLNQIMQECEWRSFKCHSPFKASRTFLKSPFSLRPSIWKSASALSLRPYFSLSEDVTSLFTFNSYQKRIVIKWKELKMLGNFELQETEGHEMYTKW